MREATITRETAETRIRLMVNLDGKGACTAKTGVGFFDHMLDHIARHGQLDLDIDAEGDLHIDAHHTVEDAGICLGQAILAALGDRTGIARYGSAIVPMDEALAEVAIDLSGRPFLVFHADIPKVKLGEFDAELAEEFFRAVAVNSRATVHVNVRYGSNVHHCVEGIFKAFGRALRQAVERDPRIEGVPSTKGMLQQ